MNHLIHILARNNLLSETELPGRLARTVPAPRERMPYPLSDASPSSGLKWDSASSPELQVVIDDDDDFSNLLMSSLDLPNSFDPPMLL
jgi:hypothetical protein